jgi:choline transport protein
VCAWQADLAAIFYLGGTIIQGMIVMNYPDYDFKRWHGTLLLWAVIIIGVAFNTVLARLLPWVEGTILITHCIGFIVVLVPVVYLGPHESAADVFAKYLTRWTHHHCLRISRYVRQCSSLIQQADHTQALMVLST